MEQDVIISIDSFIHFPTLIKLELYAAYQGGCYGPIVIGGFFKGRKPIRL